MTDTSGKVLSEVKPLASAAARGSRFQLLKDLSALSLGEMAAKVIGFSAFAYLARVLTRDGYGAVELAASVSLFYSMIIDCGLEPIGARQVARERDAAADLSASIPSARFCIALAAAPLSALTIALIGGSSDSVALGILFSTALLAMPWKQQWLFQGLEMMWVVAAAQVINMLSFAVIVVLFVNEPSDLLWVGVAHLVATALMACHYMAFQRARVARVRLAFGWQQIGSLIRQGLSMGVAHFAWAFHLYAPIAIVTYWVGEHDAAPFGAAHRIVVALLSFSFLYHFSLFPVFARLAKRSGRDLEQLVFSSMRVVGWLGSAAALGLTVGAPWLMSEVFGEKYAASGPAFAILIWVVPVTMLAGHARWSLVAIHRQKYVAVAQCSGALTLVVIGMLAVPLWEIRGAAIAMLCANLAVWGVSQWCSRDYLATTGIVRILAVPGLLVGTWAWFTHYALSGAALVEMFPWLPAMVATLGMCCSALILDRRLLASTRHVLQAKSQESKRTGGGAS